MVEDSIFAELGVVIVFYNGDENVLRLVDTFSEFIDAICVVNNHSEHGIEILDILGKREDVTLINNDTNYGIAYALNQGLEYARNREKNYLLTMDQDSFIDMNDIQHLLESIRSTYCCVSVGPYYGESEPDTEKPTKTVNYLITSGNIIDVSAAFEIGGFDEKLFIDCVDIDFSFNILTHQKKMLKCGNAFMQHKIGEYDYSKLFKIKYKGHSPLRYYYIYRNNILIYRRYWKKLPYLCLKLFLSLLRNSCQLILVETNKKEKMMQAMKGIKDGIRSKK